MLSALFLQYVCRFTVENASINVVSNHEHCTKKWSFPLRFSSVNVTKSTGNCGFGQIYLNSYSYLPKNIALFASLKTL